LGEKKFRYIFERKYGDLIVIIQNSNFVSYLYYLARRRFLFTLEITIRRTNRMVENFVLLGYYAASSGNCNYHTPCVKTRMRAVSSTFRWKREHRKNGA
jgi:hypothetical protein